MVRRSAKMGTLDAGTAAFVAKTLTFAERTDGDRGRWVHTAQSWFHDIRTAAELNLPRVWVDRLDSGEDASVATVRIPDVTELPDAVERAASAGGA